MSEEYDGGISDARVMVENVTIPEALEYKEKILAVDGVTDITWLDDVVDIHQPLEYMDADTVDTYYRDSAALFSVTITEEKRIDACSAIREIIGDDNAMAGSAVATMVPLLVSRSMQDDNAMTGSAVPTAVATTSTVTEIPLIAVAAVNDGVTTASGAMTSLKNGSSSLSSGAGSLASGLNTLNTGVNSASSGLGQLYSGAETLESSLGDLSDGIDTLYDGLGDLDDRAAELVSGLGDLKDGSEEMKAPPSSRIRPATSMTRLRIRSTIKSTSSLTA